MCVISSLILGTGGDCALGALADQVARLLVALASVVGSLAQRQPAFGVDRSVRVVLFGQADLPLLLLLLVLLLGLVELLAGVRLLRFGFGQQWRLDEAAAAAGRLDLEALERRGELRLELVDVDARVGDDVLERGQLGAQLLGLVGVEARVHVDQLGQDAEVFGLEGSHALEHVACRLQVAQLELIVGVGAHAHVQVVGATRRRLGELVDEAVEERGELGGGRLVCGGARLEQRDECAHDAETRRRLGGKGRHALDELDGLGHFALREKHVQQVELDVGGGGQLGEHALSVRELLLLEELSDLEQSVRVQGAAAAAELLLELFDELVGGVALIGVHGEEDLVEGDLAPLSGVQLLLELGAGRHLETLLRVEHVLVFVDAHQVVGRHCDHARI